MDQSENYPNRVLLANLDYKATEQDIETFFKQEKNIDCLSCEVLMNPKVQKPSGAAYVSFTNEEDTQAVVEMDGSPMNGRKLFVNLCSDNSQLKRFLSRIGGLSYRLRDDGNPEIIVDDSAKKDRGSKGKDADVYMPGRPAGSQSKYNTDAFINKRLFVHNLPYDADWAKLKDFFIERGFDRPYVTFMDRPQDGKPAGCGVVELKNEEDAERAANEFDKADFCGREILINRDDARHTAVRGFCMRTKCGYKIEAKSGRPVLIPEDHPDNVLNPRNKGSNREPGVYYPNGPVNQNSSSLAGGMQMRGVDVPRNFMGMRRPDGMPLIDNQYDILGSFVLVANLPFECDKNDLLKTFKTCGYVEGIEMLRFRDEDGDRAGKFKGMAVVEYTRARDAQRALIVYDNFDFQGRRLNVRLAKEIREMPETLRNINRPIEETRCVDMCQRDSIFKKYKTPSLHQIDPYSESSLFVANLPFETTRDQIKKLFYVMAECRSVVILTEGGKKDGRSKGIAIVQVVSGMDAVQCINVFHEAEFQGRSLKVRLDQDASSSNNGNFRGGSTMQPVMIPYQPMQPFGAAPSANQSGFGQTPSMYPMTQMPLAQNSQPSNINRPPATDDATVRQLAAVLGVDADALQKLRNQSSGKDDRDRRDDRRDDYRGNRDYGRDNYRNNDDFGNPPAQDNYNRESGRYDSGGRYGRDRSPVRGGSHRNNYNARDRSPPRNNEPYRSVQTGYNPSGGNRGVNRNEPKREVESKSNIVNNNMDTSNNTGGSDQQKWAPTTKDTIYISNIPKTFTEARLTQMMTQCGHVRFIDFPMDSNNRPVGYAYVRFSDDFENSVRRAVGGYDGFLMDGQKIVVGQY